MEREAPFFLRARSCRSRVERLWIAKFHQGPERSARFARCARSLAALAKPRKKTSKNTKIPSKLYTKTLQNSGLEGHVESHFPALGGSQHKALLFILLLSSFFGLAQSIVPTWVGDTSHMNQRLFHNDDHVKIAGKSKSCSRYSTMLNPKLSWMLLWSSARLPT